MISGIFALDSNNLFGKGGKLAWYISDDFKFFKEQTLGSAIIMGWNTWQSIKRPLPGRLSIVITSRKFGIEKNGVYFVNSFETALKIAYTLYKECYVIGGTQLIESVISKLDRLIVTHIDMAFDGDIYLNINFNDWISISERKLNSYCKVKYYIRR